MPRRLVGGHDEHCNDPTAVRRHNEYKEPMGGEPARPPMVLSPTTSVIAEPASSLLAMREVLCEVGTYLCVVVTPPECLRCLSSVCSLPPGGTLAAQSRDVKR